MRKCEFSIETPPGLDAVHKRVLPAVGIFTCGSFLSFLKQNAVRSSTFFTLSVQFT